MSTEPTPGYLVWRLSMKWRVAVDRALAPLGLTHAQYVLLASLYGMERAGRRPTQRDLAVRQKVTARWNKLGTPANLTPQGKALADGLPADPVTAARTYVAQHRDLLGLSQQAVDSLEVLAVNPIGVGAAPAMYPT